mmetsp:Transcript_111336/g.315181  ORF Transcript_111336/g.315181 Transcript_111336/m.315181 type:complete len:252 (+) Transcript_111336:271-1026(+)
MGRALMKAASVMLFVALVSLPIHTLATEQYSLLSNRLSSSEDTFSSGSTKTTKVPGAVAYGCSPAPMSIQSCLASFGTSLDEREYGTEPISVPSVAGGLLGSDWVRFPEMGRPLEELLSFSGRGRPLGLDCVRFPERGRPLEGELLLFSGRERLLGLDWVRFPGGVRPLEGELLLFSGRGRLLGRGWSPEGGLCLEGEPLLEVAWFLEVGRFSGSGRSPISCTLNAHELPKRNARSTGCCIITVKGGVPGA